MKRPTMLVQAMLDQLALDLGLSVERDQKRVSDRCKHEGLSFLTITLPLLCNSLEQGIESGTFTCPSSFACHGRLPRFLGGFFKRVFAKDGKLLLDPCPDSIAGLRQLLRFFKKLKIGCTASREAAAASHFLEVEGELRMMTSQIERKDVILERVSGIIWSQVFPEIDYSRLVCHHGPGVTADRYSSNERYRIRHWNQRSEHSFPSDLHCYPNFGVAAEAAREGADVPNIEYLSLRDEKSVKVVFVPKTQSAPRVIAIEPSHMQYTQQAVKDLMYAVIEEHSLTKESIRFSDQLPNQRLAYSSSIDKRLATLDLKDASDRVHLHLVQRIFKTSGLLELLEDARSLHATLPSGRNIVLTKYASMGSALCFPVEACVFYTLIQTAMHRQDGKLPSSQSIKNYSKSIDIYGDDIIIPVDYTESVVNYLESYALKVNINKSFRNSHFRESCGADYYNGIDVKPVYASYVPFDDSRLWGPTEIMSWCDKSNQFYLKGQWHIAQVIRDLVRQVARRPIPRSRNPGPGLVFTSLLFTTNLRWNRNLQCFKQMRTIYQPTLKKDDIDADVIAPLNKWGINRYLKTSKGHGISDWIERLRSVQQESSISYTANLGVCGRSHTYVGERCHGYIHELSRYMPRIRIKFLITKPISSNARRISTTERLDNGKCRTGLAIADSALNFHSSVKRGAFKPKRRWISLHG